METKFTEGRPWEIENDEDSDYFHIGPVDHRGIQMVVVSVHSEDNARLIAAAPELLAALEAAEELHMVGLFNSADGQIQRVNDLRVAAIAKAHGSQL